jgi:uncharacterized protein YqcC (DUF446 family)
MSLTSAMGRLRQAVLPRQQELLRDKRKLLSKITVSPHFESELNKEMDEREFVIKIGTAELGSMMTFDGVPVYVDHEQHEDFKLWDPA